MITAQVKYIRGLLLYAPTYEYAQEILKIMDEPDLRELAKDGDLQKHVSNLYNIYRRKEKKSWAKGILNALSSTVSRILTSSTQSSRKQTQG